MYKGNLRSKAEREAFKAGARKAESRVKQSPRPFKNSGFSRGRSGKRFAGGYRGYRFRGYSGKNRFYQNRGGAGKSYKPRGGFKRGRFN